LNQKKIDAKYRRVSLIKGDSEKQGGNMLNELIYTRCGTGRDILKNGTPQTGEGFKVHSCSEALLKDEADFSFIRNIAAVSHPFKEPDFMEDAYLYYVPEKGSPCSRISTLSPIPYCCKMFRPGSAARPRPRWRNG
jgi:hypothetical protein